MTSASGVVRLIVIERDPVFRSGLLTTLSRFADLRVMAEAATFAEAWRYLTEYSKDLHILLIGAEIQFVQQVKAQYPTLPILLIQPASPPELLAAFQAGIEGYCPKGSSIAEFIAAIRQVSARQSYWRSDVLQQLTIAPERSSISVLSVIRQNWRSLGLQQIDAALNDIEVQLRLPRVSLLDQIFLTGRRRELKAARWMVQQIFAAEEIQPPRPIVLPESSELVESPRAEIVIQPSRPQDWQAELFDRIATKLQTNLTNLTETPLEIDILKLEKKRELFFIILRQLEEALNELRFSQLQPVQLADKESMILQDVWQAVVIQFFGRYSTVRSTNGDLEIVATILRDGDMVQREILDCIPFVTSVLSHLLFQTPLIVDQTPYEIGSFEARDRAIDLLENLIIQLANAVIQPLLNRFAMLEPIKQSFYDRRLLSTREIERFRNDLSWRFRVERLFADPKAIFESRYRLFVLTQFGIDRRMIYAPRAEELQTLSGVQLAVTLALETRDAISPRLRSAIAFLGSGVVYLLTEVIGRGIGLIGRGILKGIGKSVRG